MPVFAHRLEFPFLQGRETYPETDRSAEGRLLAKIAALYRGRSINLGNHLFALEDDHKMPFLEGWKWIHTPGHSPGHISLFREHDRTLISGDAVMTVNEEALHKVLLQKKEVCGPPVYLTTSWDDAEESIRTLAALALQRIVPGHGRMMKGEELTKGLQELLDNFPILSVHATRS